MSVFGRMAMALEQKGSPTCYKRNIMRVCARVSGSTPLLHTKNSFSREASNVMGKVQRGTLERSVTISDDQPSEALGSRDICYMNFSTISGGSETNCLGTWVEFCNEPRC